MKKLFVFLRLQKFYPLSRGMTLTEVIVVIGIIIVMAALIFPVYGIFGRASALDDAKEEILGVLRLAQSKTLASESASQYGVHFEQDKFILFKGSSFDPLSFDNFIYDLSDKIEIYSIALQGGGTEVVFNRVTGETPQPGDISIRVKNDPALSKTICVSPFIIQFCQGVPVGGRLQDSRHVHFDLGWSLQLATTLKFRFLGPEPDQIETADMAAFFDPLKTEFDWNNEGAPFVVEGDNQVFRVHTHYLDASNAVLSIHRDRQGGKNTKEVIIYITDGGQDKEIAHYLADVQDTVLQGTYVFNSMQTQ